MMDMIFYIVIGMFIGWNLPQPLYAKFIQYKVLTFVRNLVNTKK